MTGHYEEFTKMFVAVDCIVFGFDGTTLQVLIGHRKMEPGRGALSLSGGFVLPNESLDDCANRTLFNLMGMENLYMKQVGAYGQVNRDPGERVLSVAYCALINVKDYNDDLRQRYGMEWMPVNHLPQLWIDHNKMVDDAITLLRKHINTEPLSSISCPSCSPSHSFSMSTKPSLARKSTSAIFANALKRSSISRRLITSTSKPQNGAPPSTGSTGKLTRKTPHLNCKQRNAGLNGLYARCPLPINTIDNNAGRIKRKSISSQSCSGEAQSRTLHMGQCLRHRP